MYDCIDLCLKGTSMRLLYSLAQCIYNLSKINFFLNRVLCCLLILYLLSLHSFLPLCLSHFVSLFVFFCESVCHSVWVCLSFCVCLFNPFLWVCLYFFVSLFVSFCESVCLHLCLLVCKFVCIPVCLFWFLLSCCLSATLYLSIYCCFIACACFTWIIWGENDSAESEGGFVCTHFSHSAA